MIRDFIDTVRFLARYGYILPLSLLVHWYFGRGVFFVAMAFLYIGMFEARAWATKQLAKPMQDELF